MTMDAHKEAMAEEFRELHYLVSVLGNRSAQQAADGYLLGLFLRGEQNES